MNDTYDVIVIGAGHNGLVTAGYLARAGLKVLVLERRSMPGGVASTEEVFPGFFFNTGSDEAGLLLPEIVDDLHLRSRGLAFLNSPVVFNALQPAGKSLVLWTDLDEARREIGNFSATDASAFPDFIETMTGYTRLLQTMMTVAPPNLGVGLQSGEALPWISPAVGLRRLGGEKMMSFLRLLPMPARDVLDEWFEGDPLKGALSALAVKGAFQGPMASGTGFLLLYHLAGSGLFWSTNPRYIQGGVAGLTRALVGALREHRGEVQTGFEVSRVLIQDGRTLGVVLASGEEVRSRIVVSAVDPAQTFFGLIGADRLPLKIVRRAKNLRLNGSTSRVNLALSALPVFRDGLGVEALKGTILVCPDIEYLERAYDVAKYGDFSSRPALEATIPTLLDTTLAPAGYQTMSINVRYTPYQLREGGWDDRREQLGDVVLETLAQFAPDLPGLVVDRQVLTPLDLEREFHLTEGSIYHGQMALDQLLFMRPIPGLGRYRTTVAGLYLCSAGTHPGGGVTGAPGYNAAREILADWREM